MIVRNEENGDDGKSVKRRRVIVDTDFKSQFELARPTLAYKELSDALPSIFVGEENKLMEIITLLCSAAKESLKQRGLHIPPWRTRGYMLCKWLSSSSDCHRAPKSTENRVKNFREAKAKAVFVSEEFKDWAGGGGGVAVKPKRRDLGGESALSPQFSTMSINCC